MYKLLTLSTFGCLLVTFSCTETPPAQTQPEVEVLKAKYGLRELAPSETSGRKLRKFTSMAEAEAWLRQEQAELAKLKARVPVPVEATVTMGAAAARARQLFVCENTYLHADMGGAGMFSSWTATWYQDQQMGPVDVTLTSHGFRIGWTWQQDKVYKMSKLDYCVQGTITLGGDFMGLPLGHDEPYYVKVGLNRECKVVMTEGYGYCGM